MSTSIFTFDHGQKKLDKAIGVAPEYLDDLQETVKKIICRTNDSIIDALRKDEDEDDGCSPSELVESALNEFSYSQLVILSSFYLRDKMEEIHKEMIKRSLQSEDGELPQGLKDILDKIRNAIQNRQSEEDNEE